eukprot:6187521-Pleurochrysis_carterae.AAC.1
MRSKIRHGTSCTLNALLRARQKLQARRQILTSRSGAGASRRPSGSKLGIMIDRTGGGHIQTLAAARRFLCGRAGVLDVHCCAGQKQRRRRGQAGVKDVSSVVKCPCVDVIAGQEGLPVQAMIMKVFCPWRAKTAASPDSQVAIGVKDVTVKTSEQAEQEIVERLDAARIPQLDVEVQNLLQARWDDFDYALGLSMVYGPCLINLPLLIASGLRIATKSYYRPNNQLDFRALLKTGPRGKPSYVQRLQKLLAAGFLFQIVIAFVWSSVAAWLIVEQRRQEHKTCYQEESGS